MILRDIHKNLISNLNTIMNHFKFFGSSHNLKYKMEKINELISLLQNPERSQSVAE